jgi:hypothetical protein
VGEVSELAVRVDQEPPDCRVFGHLAVCLFPQLVFAVIEERNGRAFGQEVHRPAHDSGSELARPVVTTALQRVLDLEL